MKRMTASLMQHPEGPHWFEIETDADLRNVQDISIAIMKGNWFNSTKILATMNEVMLETPISLDGYKILENFGISYIAKLNSLVIPYA